MVKKITFKKILTDEEAGKLESEYIGEKFYKQKNPKQWLINYDCDGYDEEGKLLFIYRKNKIKKNLAKIAVDNLRKISRVTHENRGASAGKLSRKSLPNYVGKYLKAGKFRTTFYSKITGKLSKQSVSNLAPSNIIGFYDKSDRNLLGKGAKIRKTQYLRDHPEKWKKIIPYFQNIDKIYQKAFVGKKPNIYQEQKKRANKVKKYTIPGTAFSTATVNYSWRTGVHKDKANYAGGLALLTVIEDPANKNTYDGCYLGFPQYGFAVDVRDRDILITDNRIGWHGNTEFKGRNSKIYDMGGGKMPSKRQKQNNWYYNRMSLVMYMRESMIEAALNAKSLKNQKGTKKLKTKSLALAGGGKKSIKNNKIKIEY